MKQKKHRFIRSRSILQKKNVKGSSLDRKKMILWDT